MLLLYILFGFIAVMMCAVAVACVIYSLTLLFSYAYKIFCGLYNNISVIISNFVTVISRGC